MTGAVSCGCFGSFHVNPWFTLFVIDLPVVLSLLFFIPDKPANNERFRLTGRIFNYTAHAIFFIVMTSVILAYSGKDDFDYETVIVSKGYTYDINKDVFLQSPSERGYKVIIFYKRECSNCIETINVMKRMLKESLAKEVKLNILLIEIPPFGTDQIKDDKLFTFGILANSLQKNVKPKVVFMKNNLVFDTWSTENFDYEDALQILHYVNS